MLIREREVYLLDNASAIALCFPLTYSISKS